MTTRGKAFEPGQSGNPSGRTKGARNRVTLAMEAILDGEAEALTRKAIEMALDGDGPAMRLCMDRLCPPRKDRIISFQIPRIETAEDAAKATGAMLEAVANGEITPGEAGEFGKLVSAHVEAIKATDFEKRLQAIEEGRNNVA